MGRTLVFHSLGEFLWDPGVGNVVEPRWENARRLTAILEVTVGTDRDMKYRLLPFRRGEDFRLRALEGSEEGNFQRWFGEISSIYENYDSSAYLEGASQGVVEHVFKVIGFHIRQRNLAYLVGLLRRIRPRHLRIAVFHLARKLRGVVSR